MLENYLEIDHLRSRPWIRQRSTDHGAPHPYRANHAEIASGRDRAAGMARRPDVRGDRWRPVALEAAVHAWQRTVEELGAEAVEESRRQYCAVRRACGTRCGSEPDPPPQKTFAAIEIISLLARQRAVVELAITAASLLRRHLASIRETAGTGSGCRAGRRRLRGGTAR